MKQSKAIKLLSLGILYSCVIFICLCMVTIFIKGIGNIIPVIRDKEFLYALKLSLSISSVSTLLIMILSIPAGYALAKYDFKFKKFIFVIINIPQSLPYLVIGVSLLTVFSGGFGNILKYFGIDVVFNKNGIFIVQFMINLPFAITLIQDSFRKIDRRYELVAMKLGANPIKAFIDVNIKMNILSLISVGLVCFSRAVGEFGATLMLVGVTAMRTETLSGYIFLNVSTGNTDKAMSAALVLMFISLIITIVGKYITGKNDYYARRR